jgi:hypothetical protein
MNTNAQSDNCSLLNTHHSTAVQVEQVQIFILKNYHQSKSNPQSAGIIITHYYQVH